MNTKKDYDFHSTQINLTDHFGEKDVRFQRIVDMIPAEHVYKTENKGKEWYPHITILCGIINESDYFKLRKELESFGKIEIEIGNISSFRRKDYPFDVLYFKIKSPKLHKLQKMIDKLTKNKNTFKKYSPHITISYIKKGTCKHLENQKNILTGEKIIIDTIYFAHADNYFIPIPLNNKKQEDNTMPIETEIKQLKSKLSSPKKIIEYGNRIGIDWKKSKFSKKDFIKGWKVELEHAETVNNDPIVISKITYDHLLEDPKYYDKIEKIHEEH